MSTEGLVELSVDDGVKFFQDVASLKVCIKTCLSMSVSSMFLFDCEIMSRFDCNDPAPGCSEGWNAMRTSMAGSIRAADKGPEIEPWEEKKEHGPNREN